MSNPLALYQLADEFMQQAAALADLDLDAQTLADTLESISGDFEQKATNVVLFARNLEATEQSIDAAIEKMKARRDALANRSAALRQYVLQQMLRTGIKKVEGPYVRLSVRATPAPVDVFDAAQIPTEFMRQPEPPPPAPDKRAIKAALEAGRDVPGARMGERGTRLHID